MLPLLIDDAFGLLFALGRPVVKMLGTSTVDGLNRKRAEQTRPTPESPFPEFTSPTLAPLR